MIQPTELLKILACPRCRQPLASFARCDACGESFDDVDGTPVLIAEGARRDVSFRFEQSRSTAGLRFKHSFKYPPRCGAASGGNPYHLDLGHLDVLESLAPGSSVLEIGCGGGQMRTFLGGKSLQYVGTDISKTRVHDHLRAHGGPDVLCDAHFLPFADAAFDCVYSAAVTEHLACPQLVAQEVARVLKPGGFYLGNVSFLEPWHDASFYHMTPLGVHELLTQADFDVRHIWPSRGYSGFRSILRMGNKITRRLTLAGDLMFLIYNAGNGLRNRLKRREAGLMKSDIADAAKVSGATDWIAQRRDVEPHLSDLASATTRNSQPPVDGGAGRLFSAIGGCIAVAATS
jgi:SAM-dependent methyltransferase/uncharacterized protein YbaR (Trm112 family)